MTFIYKNSLNKMYKNLETQRQIKHYKLKKQKSRTFGVTVSSFDIGRSWERK
jgi:hypothetical protein